MKRLVGAALALALISSLPGLALAQFSGGGGGGAAGVSSLATFCPTSGAATGAVTLTGGLQPVARSPVTGATDTMLSTDCAGLIVYNNASGVAVTGLSASAAGAGFATTLVNTGAAPVTVTSAGGNFSSTGTLSLVIAPGSSASIQSDASKWNVFARSFPLPTRAGDLLYWSGMSWGAFAGNNSGTNCLQESSAGVPSWAACGSGGSGGSPGGSTGAIQFNNGSGFGGSAVVAAGDVVTGNGSSGPQDSGFSITGDATASLASLKAHPGYVSGEYYPPIPSSGISGAAITSGTVYCGPMIVGLSGETIKALGVYQATASATADNLSIAIYTSSSGRPSSLVAYATMAELASLGQIAAASNPNPATLKGGFYWICSTQDNSVGAFFAFSAATDITGWYGGASTVAKVVGSTNDATGFSCTSASTCGSGVTPWSSGAFGWPTTFSGATWAEVNSGSLVPFAVTQAN